MDLIQFSIRNPVTVIVGVALVILFGLVSLARMPYRLSPHVEEPVISVTTRWPGATPYEIERDIVEEQEKYLKGIPGVVEMESSSSNNEGEIQLRFTIDTDIDDALLRVSNKIQEVQQYPENVDRPVITASGAESSPVVWLTIQTLEGNPRPIETYYTYVEDEIRQYIERIPDVASLWISGGTEQQMHVLVKPEKLAAHNLTINAVIQALRNENANISAGNLPVSRREYRVRTVAEFRSIEDIKNVILVSDGQRRVTVGDVADVQFGYERPTSPMLRDGRPGISIGVVPEPDANVLELTDRVESVVNELNAGKLAKDRLRMDIVSDQRPYIRGAIALVRQNILVGAALAVVVLLLFLRKIGPTVVVGVTIPISVIGTFIFMHATGSSLNVVSMSGIAFAVGMLVDNAIVILENIDRHVHMGKSPEKAAYEGTREVWGAVLLATLTNVAVFLPVVFLQQEAGQLFREIALAVCAGAILSLATSVSVVPVLSRYLFRRGLTSLDGGAESAGLIARFGRRCGNAFAAALERLVLRNLLTRLATVLTVTLAALALSYLLLPKMEYLPEGNRDLIFNRIILPPGLSYEERERIGYEIHDFLRPYYQPGYEGLPGISRTFYIGRGTQMILGVVSADQARTRELIPVCREAISRIPSAIGVSSQASIFSGRGRGRSIDVDISGHDMDQLIETARAMYSRIGAKIADVQIRPRPALEVLYPEVRFVPSRERLRALGMSAQEVGIGVDVLMDGRDIGDFKQEGRKKIELVVKADDSAMKTPEDLHSALLSTPKGETIPLSSVADMVKTTGITEIRHLERDRTITLQVTPPYTITIQEAMEIIQQQVIPEMESQGLLGDARVTLSGTADRLTETRQALQWNFLLAATITYLLMASLYGNFVYPLVVMFTLPLAGAGGFIGLRIVQLFVPTQQLDILTMLGFIILVGVVVNNAILIVHQALNNIRFEGMAPQHAILDSARTRIRPIYMSAATSVIGMLPLVVWPGPGSELYRGLGSVLLGGLVLSTFVTFFLIPPLLMFVIWMENRPHPPSIPPAS